MVYEALRNLFEEMSYFKKFSKRSGRLTNKLKNNAITVLGHYLNRDLTYGDSTDDYKFKRGDKDNLLILVNNEPIIEFKLDTVSELPTTLNVIFQGKVVQQFEHNTFHNVQ